MDVSGKPPGVLSRLRERAPPAAGACARGLAVRPLTSPGELCRLDATIEAGEVPSGPGEAPDPAGLARRQARHPSGAIKRPHGRTDRGADIKSPLRVESRKREESRHFHYTRQYPWRV